MGKLVDDAALINALNLAEWFNIADFNEAVYTVRKAQPVDAVPVVRCRDCKHHDGIRCFRWNSTIITGFDDFCSNGEQNDGKGNGNEAD